MKAKILWLDNDPYLVIPYVGALKAAGYDVTVVGSTLAAENLLETQAFNLAILDVMIPTVAEAEEFFYQPELTEYGVKTGLIFYHRMKSTLDTKGIKVLVMTVRLDQRIKDEFIQEGLDPENFVTKLALRHRSTFLEKVGSILGDV